MVKLCLLCCFTCTPARGQLSGAGENNLEEDPEKCPQLEEFCKDLKLDLKGLVGTLKSDWKDVSICGHCLDSVGNAVEESMAMRELEVVVRRLQQELLEKMRDLNGAVESWQRELRKVEGIVRNSEEGALLCRRKIEVNEEVADAVVKFRKRIGEVPAEVGKFSGSLFQKVGGALAFGEKETPRRNSASNEGSLEASVSVEESTPEAVTHAPNDGEAPENGVQLPEACPNNSEDDSTPSCSSSKLLQSKMAKRVSFAPFPTTYSVGPAPAMVSGGVSMGNNDQDWLSDIDSDSTSSEDDLLQRIVSPKTLDSGTGTSAVIPSNTAYHEKLDTSKKATVSLVRPAPIPGTSLAVTPAASTSSINSSQNRSERLAKADNPLPELGSVEMSRKDAVRRSVRRKHTPDGSAAGVGNVPTKVKLEVSPTKGRNRGKPTSGCRPKTVKQSMWPCKICGRSFSLQKTLRNHLIVHSSNRPYQCSRCDKAFKLKSGLNRHIRAVHQGLKPFACDLCQKRFSRKDNLISHRRTHTGEKSFACPLCEYRCSVKSCLEVHMRKHTGEKPYRCNNCTQRFRHLASLINHQRRAHAGNVLSNKSNNGP